MVVMSDFNDDNIGKTGYSRFDYGYYDPSFLPNSNRDWWHADQGGPQMTIYLDTFASLTSWKRDFNRTVFGVALTTTTRKRKE